MPKDQPGQAAQSLPPLHGDGTLPDDIFYRYEANLFVDNGPLSGAPVVVEDHPTYFNLMVLKGTALPVLEAESTGKTLAELSDSQHPFFGEMALLDRDIRSATVTCLTDCRFLRIDRERFFNFLTTHPAIGVKLVTVLARRLARVVRKNNVDLVKLTTALALVLSRRGKNLP